MPSDIDLHQLDQLLAAGGQLVEVLPADEYEEEHLPDAINIPLRRVASEAVEKLDRGRPVIVYCWDAL